MAQTDSGTDRNISLVAGWNLIGYTGNDSFALDNALFTNSSGSQMTLSNAVANNKLQAYMPYYDSSSAIASQRKYKYAAESDLEMDDSSLRTGRGYWVYANQAGNLTLPGVGGTIAGQSYARSKLRLSNGTSELTFDQAGSAGWIDSNVIYYWDGSAVTYRYVCEKTGDLSLDPENCLTTSLDSSQGYFIKSNIDNLTLIRQN